MRQDIVHLLNNLREVIVKRVRVVDEQGPFGMGDPVPPVRELGEPADVGVFASDQFEEPEDVALPDIIQKRERGAGPEDAVLPVTAESNEGFAEIRLPGFKDFPDGESGETHVEQVEGEMGELKLFVGVVELKSFP